MTEKNQALVRFGPAGHSQSFHDMGYKDSLSTADYLVKMGLNAYEYQCGRGVNIGEEKAAELGRRCAAADIRLSLHAPYYISMASADEEKRLHSIDYILQSARAVRAMGGDRIVIHPGATGKMPREDAVALAADTFRLALKALDDEGLSHIRLCPETMGKLGQLGTLDEVLHFCALDERFIPCIDFGHLNARTQGGLRTMADFEAVFTGIRDRLGESRLKEFHAHISKIEYTQGGERCHLTFADEQYGPDYRPILELTHRYDCRPTLICESAGTQAEDAATMKAYYESL